MLNTQMPGLYIMEDEVKGRGVYCSEDITEGSMIELCPILILSPQDTEKIHATALHDYYFIWDRDIKSSCIALGYGSLYNHSDKANAEFLNDYESNMIRIQALTDIPAHQEICINYISKDEEEFSLWFEKK
jgi:SET domain-containing protein